MTRSRHITTQRRAGLANLAIAGAVALLLWFSVWLWREPSPPRGEQRPLTNVTVTWECVNGHRYEALGDYGIGTCTVCGAEAYILVHYRCPVHGEMKGLLWRERNDRGGSTIAGIRFQDGPWIQHPTEIRCPQCGRRLQTVKRDLYHSEATQKGE